MVSSSVSPLFFGHIPLFLHTPSYTPPTPLMELGGGSNDLSGVVRSDEVRRNIAELAAGVVAAAAAKRPSKRHRALQNYRQPNKIASPVPVAFSNPATLTYDQTTHDFGAAFAADLARAGKGPQDLLGMKACKPEDRPAEVRKALKELCAAYELFVRTKCVVPLPCPVCACPCPCPCPAGYRWLYLVAFTPQCSSAFAVQL